MRRAVRILLLAIVAGGIVFLFVVPGREWMGQSRAMSQDQRQLKALTQESSLLSEQASQLQTARYVEQIAHEEYGLVMPGQTPYGIVLPRSTTTVPSSSTGSN